MNRAALVLLLSCCARGPGPADGGDTDLPPETDETDPPADTDRDDTGLEVDTDAIFSPAPGVVVDRGSVSWQRIQRQPVRCTLLQQVASNTWNVIVMGMSDGTLHTLVRGLVLAPPFDELVSARGNRLAIAGGVLYASGSATGRFEVDAASWAFADPAGAIAHYGAGIAVGGRVYRSWERLVAEEPLDSAYSPMEWSAGYAGHLYIQDGSRLVRLDPRTGEELRAWTWQSGMDDDLVRSYDGLAVVAGPTAVVRDEAGADRLVIFDVARDAHLATFPLPELADYVGPACESATR